MRSCRQSQIRGKGQLPSRALWSCNPTLEEGELGEEAVSLEFRDDESAQQSLENLYPSRSSNSNVRLKTTGMHAIPLIDNHMHPCPILKSARARLFTPYEAMLLPAVTVVGYLDVATWPTSAE